jgi:hypothetical protein
VENRKTDIEHLQLPDWKSVQARQYQPWSKAIIQIDTAGKSINQATEELISRIKMS